MKKIFRMALVFALAGATLMYTGCTKDYQEEINKLDSQISNLESSLNGKLGDLQTELSNIRSSVTSLENAYKAADTAFAGDITGLKTDVSGLKTDVAALQAALKDLEKYATKDELSAAKTELEKKITDDLAALKAEILGKTDELSQKLTDLETKLKAELDKKANAEEIEIRLKALEEAQASVNEVYGFLSDELRSIVFFPDFYFGGVEATSYDFASLWGLQPVASTAEVKTTDDKKAAVSFPKGQKITAEEVISKNSKGIIYYAVDPNSYEYVLGEDGKPVVYKDGMKDAYGQPMLKYPWWPTNRTMGQVGIARYDLNPSSFPIDSAEWSLTGMNRKYVVKAEEALFWQPVFEGITKNGQQAEVQYSIANPEVLFSSIISAFPASYLKASDLEAAVSEYREKETERMENVRWYYEFLTFYYETGSFNNVPVMQLIGKLDENRDIRSDWHAICSSEEMVDHLAFINGNGNKTTQVYPGTECTLGRDAYGPAVKDLYATAKLAAENVPSLPVKYNEGPVDLAKEIAIHTMDPYTKTPIAAYTLDQFVKKYPGFSYKFELIKHTVGDNKTSEDRYGVINGTEFTACYVKPDGTQVVIAKDSEDKEGISSVGRKPIVLAYLVDEAGNSYAVGYFKIEIVKEKRQAEETIINLPDRGTVPFICGEFELKTTWSEYSYYVLETLKVDYDDFAKEYTFDGVYSYQIANVNGMLIPQLVKIGEGTKASPALKYNEPQADGSVKALDFGNAYYEVDKTGSTVNDKFVWKVKPQDIGQGNSKSIYFKFKKSEYEIAYFVMDANIAAAAKFVYGKKLANEWYDDVNGEAVNTGRINVLVPTATDDDVTEFYRDLNKFLEGEKVQLVLSDDSDPVYKKFYTNPATSGYNKAEMSSKVVYYFSDEQPVIKGINKLTDFWYDAQGRSKVTDLPLLTNWWEDNSKLFVPEYIWKSNKYVMQTEDLLDEDGNPVLDDNDDPVQRPTYLEKNLIATLTPEGVLTYSYAEGQTAAKVLLNLWSYLETETSKMLYANVLVDMFYGECEIPAGEDGFHMRFVRPIDIQFADADVASESKVTGYNLLVAKFISGITDWNKMKVIVPAPERDEDNKPVKDEDGNIIYTEYFEPNVLNEVDMYAYYGFKKLTIDIDNAERDHFRVGEPDLRGSLKEITPTAILKVGSVVFGEDDYGRPTEKFTEGENTIDISNLDNLKGACIHYENGRAVIEMFYIYIPVTVEYAWGTITGELKIKVNKTKDTPGE